MMIIVVLIVILILVFLKIFAVLTTVKCKSKTSLHAKTVLITGADSGIGYHTALDIASRGAKLIITSNNRETLLKAQKKLIEQTGNENIIAKYLELLSLDGIRAFASDILKSEERLDVLINNAGTAIFGKEISKDGLNSGLQVNHFGPFLLTHLLLDLLKKSQPSRIVNVASIASFAPWLDEDNINSTPNFFSQGFTYSNSKYLMAATTFELAKRLRGSGVTVNCLHPGVVKTDIYRKAGKYILAIKQVLVSFMKNSEEGAQTTIELAVSRKFENITGRFCLDCIPFYFLAPLSAKRQLKIWNQSVKLVKLQPEEIHC